MVSDLIKNVSLLSLNNHATKQHLFFYYFPLIFLFFSPQASDDTHIMFINTIHNNDSDVITRNYINITFVCRYPINYMVQQPNGENMIRVDVRYVLNSGLTQRLKFNHWVFS